MIAFRLSGNATPRMYWCWTSVVMMKRGSIPAFFVYGFVELLAICRPRIVPLPDLRYS